MAQPAPEAVVALVDSAGQFFVGTLSNDLVVACKQRTHIGVIEDGPTVNATPTMRPVATATSNHFQVTGTLAVGTTHTVYPTPSVFSTLGKTAFVCDTAANADAGTLLLAPGANAAQAASSVWLTAVKNSAATGSVLGSTAACVPMHLRASEIVQYAWTGNVDIATGGSGHVLLNALNASANVGVGTAAPAQRLHVVGNILATGSVTAATVAGALAGDGSGITSLDADKITTGTLAVARGGSGTTTATGTGTGASVVLSAGPTLTGNTTVTTLQFPSTVVDRKLVLWDAVGGAGGGAYYGLGILPSTLKYNVADLAASHVFTASNVEIMRVRGDGNVGMGTSTPTEKLQVAGNAVVDGTLRVAGNAVVDGTLRVAGDVQCVGSIGGPGSVPIGVVMMWTSSTAPPSEWVLCDGRSLSRATYSALFAVVGTAYGSVSGATFNVPDLRSRFVVGAGTGASLSARALAATGGEEAHTLSSAEMPVHSHAITVVSNGSHSHSGATDTAAAHTHAASTGVMSANQNHAHSVNTGSIDDANWGGGGGQHPPADGADNGASYTTNSANTDHTHSVSIQSGGQHSHVVTTASAGDHAHAASAGSAGGGAAHAVMPPFLVLQYIIRVT